MRIAVALAITLGAFALSPVFAASAEPAETLHHHYHYHYHHHHNTIIIPCTALPPSWRRKP